MDFGAKVASELVGGEVFALSGDLGAGKTTFSKGFARALGVEKQVTSPTFNIMKIYPIKNKKIRKLVHVDAYRLESVEDANSIGLDEIISDPTSVTIVEWPERIWGLIKNRAISIKFTFVSETNRKIDYGTNN